MAKREKTVFEEWRDGLVDFGGFVRKINGGQSPQRSEPSSSPQNVKPAPKSVTVEGASRRMGGAFAGKRGGRVPKGRGASSSAQAAAARRKRRVKQTNKSGYNFSGPR